MPTEKKIYDLVIGGVPFKLKTFHDEQRVKELVTLVDQKISQAMDSTKTGSLQSAAILAALNIAEELLTLKLAASRELERLEQRATKLSFDLENTNFFKGNV
jgi:cell division protein ZapA